MSRKSQKYSLEAVFSALLQSGSISVAAKRLGCTTRTIHRYLENPKIKAEFKRRRENQLEHATSWLESATAFAIDSLQRNTNCENPATEVRAARTILEMTCRLREHMASMDRLETLEKELHELKIKVEQNSQGSKASQDRPARES